MRVSAFIKRNFKEIIRDPLTLVFGLGFPLVLLLLLSTIQRNIPVSIFEIDNLTPGVTVFGLSFITLFTATLMARDRESAFLHRLYTTPLTAFEFIIGYMLSVLPIALGQTVICYLFSFFFGATFKINIIYAIIGIIPVSVLNISLGVLFGSILNVKQVGGICGALLTNLSAWLSGVWFDLALVGGLFEKIAYYLPFVHAVEMEKALLNGGFYKAFLHLLPILIYIIITFLISVLCFLRNMKKQ